MNKMLLSVAAVAALTAASAAPAFAQSWGGQMRPGQYDAGPSYRDQGPSYGARGQAWGDQGRFRRGAGDQRLTTAYVDSLDWRIANAAREGRLSWGEARQLRAEVRAVHDMVWRVETRQARPQEVARVDQVVRRVERAVGGYADGRVAYQGRGR